MAPQLHSVRSLLQKIILNTVKPCCFAVTLSTVMLIGLLREVGIWGKLWEAEPPCGELREKGRCAESTAREAALGLPG